MRNLLKSLLLIAALGFGLSSCTDKCKNVLCPSGYTCDEGDCITDPNTTGNEVKTGSINTDETWTAENIYELNGRVVVVVVVVVVGASTSSS